MLGYTYSSGWRDWNFQFNVKNVLDKRYYLPNIVPSDPRQAFFSVGVLF